MADNNLDPAADTQQFRAFVQQGRNDQAVAKGVSTGLVVGVTIAVIAMIAVVAFAFLAL